MSLKYPTDDADVETIVRDETSYDDTPDELPSGQLDTIIQRSKGRLELETGVAEDTYFSDDGLGYALAAYTCMRAKAAVENIPLSSYNIGDEQVSFNTDDPEDSQQLAQWAEDVRVGLDASDLDEEQGPTASNTAGYIGESSIPSRHHDDYDTY